MSILDLSYVLLFPSTSVYSGGYTCGVVAKVHVLHRTPGRGNLLSFEPQGRSNTLTQPRYHRSRDEPPVNAVTKDVLLTLQITCTCSDGLSQRLWVLESNWQ